MKKKDTLIAEGGVKGTFFKKNIFLFVADYLLLFQLLLD